MTFPSRSDAVVARLSQAVGGPLGERAGHHPWWTPQRVLLAVTALVLAAGVTGRRWSELAGGDPTGTTQSWAANYLDGRGLSNPVLAVIVAALLLGVTWLLCRVDPDQPWAAAGWAASPLLAVHWLSWDAFVAAGLAVALWGWVRAQPIATAIGGFVVVAFGHQLVTTVEPDLGSIWQVLHQWRDQVPGLGLRWLVSAVVLAVAAAAAVHVVRRGSGAATTARGVLILGAAVLVLAPSAPPEAALILLPVAALAGVRWGDLLVWQGIELVFWALTQLFLAGLLAPASGDDVRVYWLAVLVRMGGLCWLAVAALRATSGDVDDIEVGGGEPDSDVDGLAH